MCHLEKEEKNRQRAGMLRFRVKEYPSTTLSHTTEGKREKEKLSFKRVGRLRGNDDTFKSQMRGKRGRR